MKRISPYLKVMRIDHWHKNLFILPGILFAWSFFHITFTDTGAVRHAAAAFLIACLASSVNYIINEILDAKYDRYHPEKKHRPVPSGEVKIGYCIGLIVFLLIIVFSAARYLVSAKFTFFVVLFLISGLIYNVPPVRAKDVAYLDTIVESFNNPVRFLIGWFSICKSVMPPSSLLISTWCLGGFMMAAKRYAEYSQFQDKTAITSYRKSFKFYSKERLIHFMVFWIALFCLMFGVFVIRVNINTLITFPLIAIFFAWYMKLAFEEDSVVQKPEEMIKRPVFLSYSLLIFILTMTIIFLGDRITVLNWIFEKENIFFFEHP